MSLPKDNKDSIAEPVKGLEGIVAADTKLSSVNGEKGILRYCGYNIDDLAFDTTFEETICLLYDTELPNKDRLDEMTKRIGEARVPEFLRIDGEEHLTDEEIKEYEEDFKEIDKDGDGKLTLDELKENQP